MAIQEFGKNFGKRFSETMYQLRKRAAEKTPKEDLERSLRLEYDIATAAIKSCTDPDTFLKEARAEGGLTAKRVFAEVNNVVMGLFDNRFTNFVSFGGSGKLRKHLDVKEAESWTKNLTNLRRLCSELGIPYPGDENAAGGSGAIVDQQ